MKAVVIGATGATGKDLVAQLLSDPQVEQVRVLVRRKWDIEHEKLIVHCIHFDDYLSWKQLVQGDVAFCCLGTTKKVAGSQSAQKVVDLDYPLAFAKAAKENEIPKMVLVSAFGANENSKIFYSQLKGKLEKAIIQLHFSTTFIFQPGLLDRENTDRKGEKWMLTILKIVNKMGFFKKYKPLSTKILAQSMIENAKNNATGVQYIRLDEIWKTKIS